MKTPPLVVLIIAAIAPVEASQPGTVEDGHTHSDKGYKDWVLEKAKDGANWAAANPGSAACLAGGLTALAAPGVVAIPLLHHAGFTAVGVQAGSVAAGSWFTIGQSAGAGGYGFPIVQGMVQGVGVGVGAVGAGWKHLKRWTSGDDGEEGTL
ncbi:uncharacterized protein BO97DRAFT_423758 [Aspergillus homomorphus CBS 101889]|uniref:Uncharacterized protein n=1 Tax=Aspergillus homomorphus (strain CBS 101889) TaxID=1450537 RepID=A0A395I096_ASPHC|nr:hypothetical protein BO97DRAFT_423758 [Aspergillus homomorphus CBS 101889]RAL13053.1 hypothetical protein BO97DRAFT_423758 [Aspergillus homomorphus CBS 101889]